MILIKSFIYQVLILFCVYSLEFVCIIMYFLLFWVFISKIKKKISIISA